MATIGTALYPSTSIFPGASTFPGQGALPIPAVWYSTDDASTATPTWTPVNQTKVRSFGISRGRASELSRVDAGTATIAVDDTDRAFDPLHNSLIRPMNQWWLQA